MIIALEEAKSKLYTLKEDLCELGHALRVEALKASVFDEEQQTMDPAFWSNIDYFHVIVLPLQPQRA